MFLIGSVLAAAGWLVVHFVDNIMSSPTMEYDVVYRDLCNYDNADSSIEVTIRNLSRTQKFDKLGFILRLPPERNGEFKSAEMKPKQPAYRSRGNLHCDKKAVTYPKTGILPGTELILSACYSGVTKPTFHIAEDSSIVWPVERSFFTWIIRNEIYLLGGLFIFWVATAVFITFTFRVAYCAREKLEENS